jgi:hypothetical protein
VRLDAEYVLPLCHAAAGDAALGELTRYLERLAGLLDVTVVDGSPEPVFAAHAAAWRGLAAGSGLRHLAPDPAAVSGPVLNGKVAGVTTGVRAARHRAVVVADDDVRYDAATLHRLLARLPGAQLVGPQNVLEPSSWHARWDTGRTLVNRAFGADPPGTFALDRDAFVAMGGYAADVLFENLELARTVRAAGGVVRAAPDLYVTRRAPTTRCFLEQRRRQAYDSLAQPARLAVELALLPAAVAAARRHPAAPAAGAAVVALVAEAGRRRHGGRAAFAPTAALWAPLWAAERAVLAWAALGYRLRGGVPYRGRRLAVSAHSPRQLVRRAAGGQFGRNTVRRLPSSLFLNIS